MVLGIFTSSTVCCSMFTWQLHFGTKINSMRAKNNEKRMKNFHITTLSAFPFNGLNNNITQITVPWMISSLKQQQCINKVESFQKSYFNSKEQKFDFHILFENCQLILSESMAIFCHQVYSQNTSNCLCSKSELQMSIAESFYNVKYWTSVVTSNVCQKSVDFYFVVSSQ